MSRRTNESTKGVAVADADAQLMVFVEKLQGLEGQKLLDEFCAIAQAESDCGSFKNGGDLGMFGRGAMQKPFEDASFALQVGEMTKEVVHTDSGSHLIMRIQ